MLACTLRLHMVDYVAAASSGGAVVLLFGGALGLLISVMMMARSLFEDAESAPTRRMLAHWLPIAATALVATILKRSDIAIAVIFGTSVAALSAVPGFVSMAGATEHVPPRAARVWTFLPVAAVLAFIIGFRGQVAFLDLMLLAAQGTLAAMIWVGGGDPWTDTPAEPSAAIPFNRPGLRILEAVASTLIAIVAAIAVTRGARELASVDVRYSGASLIGALLSVVLAMPMVGTGIGAASSGRGWAPMTAQAGVVYLNLCGLLPVVLLLAGMMTAFEGRDSWWSTTQPVWSPVLYPRGVWRIDAIALIIVTLAYAAASVGKIRFDKNTGGWITVGYCIYLLAVLMMGARI